MLITLDYDDAYTRDTYFWKEFIVHAHSNGHNVIGLTMRTPGEGARMGYVFIDLPIQGDLYQSSS